MKTSRLACERWFAGLLLDQNHGSVQGLCIAIIDERRRRAPLAIAGGWRSVEGNRIFVKVEICEGKFMIHLYTSGKQACWSSEPTLH